MMQWRAWCGCGWKGKFRKTMNWASRDLRKHEIEKDHYGQGNTELVETNIKMKIIKCSLCKQMDEYTEDEIQELQPISRRHGELGWVSCKQCGRPTKFKREDIAER